MVSDSGDIKRLDGQKCKNCVFVGGCTGLHLIVCVCVFLLHVVSWAKLCTHKPLTHYPLECQLSHGRWVCGAFLPFITAFCLSACYT